MRRSSLQLAFLPALASLIVALTFLPAAAWGTAAAKTKASPQLSKKVEESINNPSTKAQLNKQAQEAVSKNPQLEKEVQEYEAKQKASGAAPQTSSEAGASSVAGGQSLESLANQSRQEEQTTSTNTTTNTTAAGSTSSTGASTSTVLLIGGLVAVALLAAIAFFIYRDARSVAPAGEGSLGGSSRTSATRMRKRRAKAKAARRQRKRNR